MNNSWQSVKFSSLVCLFLFFGPIANGQTRNPKNDLELGPWNSKEVLLSGERMLLLFGTIENKSANAYACVRIGLSLYARALAPAEQRQLGVLGVEVRDLPPGKKRPYQAKLPYPAEVKYASLTECSAALAEEDRSVTIYDRANFEGPRKRSFGVGKHRLYDAADFNDVASSIRVAPGLVVIVYEDAGEDGGYGRSVDFLEDQPDLSKFKFDRQISYLDVFRSEGRWVRNRLNNGSFEPGHFLAQGQSAQYNPEPFIAPPKPPPTVATQPTTAPQPQPQPKPQPQPVFCTVTGTVIAGDPRYASLVDKTIIYLYRDNPKPSFTASVVAGKYTILNVPVGTYEVRTGPYKDMPARAVPVGDDRVLTCQPNGSANSVDFKINSSEG